MASDEDRLKALQAKINRKAQAATLKKSIADSKAALKKLSGKK